MTISKFVSSLSLDRYAEIVGLNPVHFSGSGDIMLEDGARLFPFSPDYRAYTQNESFDSPRAASREEIGREIFDAESAIEDYLGTHVTPKWIVGESIMSPFHHNRLVGSTWENVRGEPVELRPGFGRFIAGGKRASDVIIDNAPVTFLDNDNDGWHEIARITIPFSTTDDITLFDGEYLPKELFPMLNVYERYVSLYNIKIYFSNYNGSPQYEIRPPISKSILGDNLVIDFNTWQLIDPSVWGELPRDDTSRIDISECKNIVGNVDVYHEYNDTTKSHADFIYAPCGNDNTRMTQDGYTAIVNPSINTINAVPAYWEDAWFRSHINGKIKYINLNYLSGFMYKPYYEKQYWDGLHPELAKLIAYLATTRLARPLAGRAEVIALSETLQRDKTTSKPGEFLFASNAMLDNPFGTRFGEIYVFDRLQKFQHRFLRYNRV